MIDLERFMLTKRQFLKTAALSAPLACSITSVFGQEQNTGGGPRVWLDMNQAQLDEAYDQSVFAPNMETVLARLANQNKSALRQLGEPEIYKYGQSADEDLLFYRTEKKNAPIHIFVHGGTWRFSVAKDYFAVAEPIVKAGANVALINFSSVAEDNVTLATLARQVKDATAWVFNHAERLGGKPEQIFVSGHSSGGHLAGVLLVTDWQREYNLPKDIVKGGLCISGMFDLKPVRLSSRNAWLQLTDEEEQLLSPQRHINNLNAPIIIAYGTNETPEFQRQSRDFAAAVKSAGKPVNLLVAEGYNHFEILETVENPFGVVGRALLGQMGLQVE
jgi:arylformamidase